MGNTKKSQDERWTATQNKFGWLFSGPVPNNESSTETTLSTLCQMVGAQPTRNEDLNETLTKFWELNKIPDECNDPEVTDVQKHFQDTIEFNKVTGRYNVRLPWKDNKQNLPTNFTNFTIKVKNDHRSKFTAMIILHFDLQPQFKCMNYFIYTSYQTSQ